MPLPFTREQFFDLFAAYNGTFWPALVALWVTSVVASALLCSSRRPPDRWISGLLAVHWIWSALAYHVAFFSRINPAAWCREYEGGRFFYSALGHDARSLSTAFGRQHILGGLRWAAKQP